MSRRQRETAECSSVGKLTTAPVQRLQSPPRATFHHSFSPLSPCPKLLLTCTISQLFQDESARRPSRAFAEGGIVSLTPCVLCLHHFVQRAQPSALPVEFSITSHVHDTLRSVAPWRLQQELLQRHLSSVPTEVFEALFPHGSVGGVKSTCSSAYFRGNYSVKIPARVFCEHESMQQLSAQQRTSWSVPQS